MMSSLRIAAAAAAIFLACTAGPPVAEPDAGVLADAGPGTDAGSDAGFQPAFAPDAPRVISNDAGILSTPKLAAIIFSGDGDRASIEAFVSALPRSSYWSEVSAEYGIGATTAVAAQIISEA